MYFFVFWCENLLILTFNSPLIKPFIYWSLLLLTVPNKNRFSPVCSDAVFLLKRVCRVAMHTDPAQCRRAYTAHTRLQAYASLRQASAQPNCITARLGTLTASGLNGSVRLYTINYKQKMALHLLLRTETFMFLHKYFILHWHNKSHN